MKKLVIGLVLIIIALVTYILSPEIFKKLNSKSELQEFLANERFAFYGSSESISIEATGIGITTSDSTIWLGFTVVAPRYEESTGGEMKLFEQGDSVRIVLDTDTLYGNFKFISKSFYALTFELQGIDCVLIPKSSVESLGEELLLLF